MQASYVNFQKLRTIEVRDSAKEATVMRKSRFSEEQILGILKQAEVGVAVSELCRQNAISDATFYKWRSKFGGLEVAEAHRSATGDPPEGFHLGSQDAQQGWLGPWRPMQR